MEGSPFRRVVILVRSAGVGAIATAVDLFVLSVLVSGLQISPRLASVPALTLGILVQFVGNKFLAFRDRSKAWVRQGIQFAGVEALGFGANILLFDVAIAHVHLPYVVLRLIVTNGVYFAICLPLWSMIFRASSPVENP